MGHPVPPLRTEQGGNRSVGRIVYRELAPTHTAALCCWHFIVTSLSSNQLSDIQRLWTVAVCSLSEIVNAFFAPNHLGHDSEQNPSY